MQCFLCIWVDGRVYKERPVTLRDNVTTATIADNVFESERQYAKESVWVQVGGVVNTPVEGRYWHKDEGVSVNGVRQ